MAKPKLNREECEVIRSMYGDRNFRETSGTLARMFHVSPCVILKVLDHTYTCLEEYEERREREAGPRENIFGPVIYAYTRAQAIEDGVLINLGMFVALGRPVLDLVGIRFPVAMTSTSYHEVTGEGEGPELLDTEVITQRVLYLLGRLKRAIIEHKGEDQTRIDFVCTNADIKPITLKALVGPGDNAEPVITIMLPGED